MFLRLTLSNAWHAHSPLERVHTGRGPTVLRIADVRSIDGWRQIYSSPGDGDHCVITMLDGRKIAVRERPEEIYDLMTAALPAHRSMQDHAVMGRIDVPVSGSVEIDGAVEHIHIDRREAVS